jgi:hypothetical protein
MARNVLLSLRALRTDRDVNPGTLIRFLRRGYADAEPEGVFTD